MGGHGNEAQHHYVGLALLEIPADMLLGVFIGFFNFVEDDR